MSFPNNLRNAIDNRVALLWPAIQTRQGIYFAARGSYWQGARTHNTPPLDNTDTPADNLAARARPGLPTWQEMWPAVPTSLPVRLEVHEYSGPKGKGYILLVTVRLSGAGTWQRVYSFGPEDKNRPWTRMVR